MSISSQQNSSFYGLVLSGGQSTRMGQDKGLLQYHGITQRQYLYQLLQQHCEKVFLSLRPGQETSLESNMQYIIDSTAAKGPINGILSALQQYPNAAFLVLACDLPLVTSSTVAKLVEERDPDKIATAYAVNGSDLPEPLLAIWEPSAQEPALFFLEETGKSCPRKFLINSNIKIVRPTDNEELYNANSPEDYQYATAKISHGEKI